MKTLEGKLDAKGIRFAIAVSRFNAFITDRLVEGAIDCIKRHGGNEEDITIVKVPGAFELPLICRKLVRMNFDAVIALGAVIRGETPHFDYIASQVSKGIATINLEFGKPVTFGVLTTDTVEQAIDRAGVKSGNKGWEAAISAIETVNLLRTLNEE
jgi:6,7-dimethyl-8-ribityllumazine synthase